MGECKIKNKCIFLDRDGVLNNIIIENEIPRPPKNLSSLKIMKGVKGSLKKLKSSNFLLIVITNQPDFARGTQSKETINKINDKLKQSLVIDDIFVCWHARDGECNCRKPKTGLFIEAHKKYSIDFKKSFMIGDRWKDIEAGNEVGCKTILIKNNYEKKTSRPNSIAINFTEATKHILKLTNLK